MKHCVMALFALFAADALYGDAPEKVVPAVDQAPVGVQAGRKPHEKTVRIAGIVLKWIRADKEANFRRVEPMIRQAAAGGAQIVCTTECFLDGYAIADKSIPLAVYRGLGETIPEGAYYKRLAALARELKIHLVAGMLEADGEARHNTAVLISPEGVLLGKYRKQHLEHELVRNRPGTSSPVFETPYDRVGLLICADRRVPEIAHRMKQGGAEFLLCPSGGMFGAKSNDWILQARSRETGLPIVFVHPAEFLVTGPDGSVLQQTVLGDVLLIPPADAGTAKDANRVFYVDLPLRAPEKKAGSSAEILKQTHVYKTVAALPIKADVYRADDQIKRPVVAWIHGGALINGHREAIDPRLKDAFLKAGYIVVSIDYRLAPETKLPGIIEDIEDAFRWIRQQGPRLFHADPGRVAVVGGSAGGYLTLMSGFRVRPRPVALVALWGYGDLVGPWYSSPSPHPRHHGVKLSYEEAFRQVAGPPIADARDRKGDGGAFYQFCRQQGLWPKAVSGWNPHTETEKFVPYMPVRNITPDFPPTLLIHGEQDTDVPCAQSVMMATELRRNKVEHQLIVVPKAEHGLAGAGAPKVEEAYRAAVSFVRKHLDRRPPDLTGARPAADAPRQGSMLPAPGAREIPAFPGAEGWGTTTPGGRNGKVLFVTSLADSGPGTLREALLTKGPRTILFRTSGIIRLEKPLWMCGPDFSCATVAGQSAPGGGIAVTGSDFIVSNGVHDVVFRHVRFRACNEGPTVHNQCKNILFDHCSFSWASDENLDIYVDTTDVTISYCVFAEGLIHGDHPKGPGHSCGLLVGKGADRVSMHHNFFTGNSARNPLLCGGNARKWRDAHVLHPSFDFRNNLVYNARGGHLAIMAGPLVNVVGNVFVHGPDTISHIPEIGLPDINDKETTTEGTKVYVLDNVGPHLKRDDPWSIVYDELHRVWGPRRETYRAANPIPAPPVTTWPSQEVAPIVLEQAGALPHDDTDRRLVREFREGKGSSGAPDRRRHAPFPPPAAGMPLPDSDADGMPDAWEIRYKLNPADGSDCWADPDKDGYGNLEEFLNNTDPRKIERSVRRDSHDWPSVSTRRPQTVSCMTK